MKFAVTAQDPHTVSGHGGHAEHFILFEGEKGAAPKETGRLTLREDQTFHHFKGGAHPLDGIDVLIAESAGQRFVEKLQERGITTVLGKGLAPDTAVAAFLMGVIGPLTDPEPCTCGHDHSHHH